MKTERIVLSFIAVFIGLLAAGATFFLYQASRSKPTPPPIKIIESPTPTPSEEVKLTVERPKEGTIVSNKSLSVSGITEPDAIIVVASVTEEQVLKPTKNGSFITTVTLGNGANIIRITAIFPDGTEQSIMRTVNYSTEDF